MHCYSQGTSISYVLFRSLCFYKILLKYLYINTRKNYSFHGIFRKWQKTLYKAFPTSFSSLFLVHWSNYFTFLRSFQILLFLTILNQMPSLNRYEKVICQNCGTQTTKLNFARREKSCSAGTLYCVQCPNFSTKSQNSLNYHFAKKHSVPSPSKAYNCKLCHAKLPGFYALRQHKNIQHGP